MPKRKLGPVEAAVAADVDGRGSESLRQAALAVARAMDETTAARDMASLSKELRATLAEIDSQTEEPTADGVDDLAAKRDARRAAAAAAVGS